MIRATFTTPIRRTRAGSTLSSALTIFSISCRKVATRTTSSLRWSGCAGTTTINISADQEDYMPRVNHFEIYTDNPEAVQPFYREIFEWKFQKFEGGPIEYWL